MTSVWILPIFTIVFGLIATAVTIFIIVKLNKSILMLDISPNLPIIDVTTRTSFTEGYSLGLLFKETPCKNGTVRLEFYPIDTEQGETKQRPSKQCIIVDKNMIKRFARGEMSSKRERILILSRNPLDIPEKLRTTDFGKSMEKEGQYAHLIKTFGESIPKGDQAIGMMMDKFYNRSGITTSALAQINEITQEVRRILINQGEEIKTEKLK